jgi:hypothetical protein
MSFRWNWPSSAFARLRALLCTGDRKAIPLSCLLLQAICEVQARGTAECHYSEGYKFDNFLTADYKPQLQWH